jgi:hypothetical protein
LHAEFVKCFEMPATDCCPRLQFTVAVGSNKAKLKEIGYERIDSTGTMLYADDSLVCFGFQSGRLSDTKAAILVKYQQGLEIPSMTITFIGQRSGINVTLGHASIPLDAIPGVCLIILCSSHHTTVLDRATGAGIDPVDLFIEKPKWKVLPPSFKLRNKQGSICRLRGLAHTSWYVLSLMAVVKLWLERDAGDADEPLSPSVEVSAEQDQEPEQELEDVIVPEIPFVPVDPASIPAPYEVYTHTL